MAEVQFKASWTCYPLHPSPVRSEICTAGVSETGRAKDDGAVKDESNTRKQLLKTLKSSIEAQGQTDAKRRKCHKAESRPENSREWEDQKTLNREHNVEVAKDDLQQAEVHKGRIAFKHKPGIKRWSEESRNARM